MSAETQFQIAYVAGKPPSVNGVVKAPLVLTVRGQQELIESVRLDSSNTIAKTAKVWAERFNLDAGQIETELRRLGRDAVARDADRRQQRQRAVEEAESITVVADRFVASLKPRWHREGTRLYLGKVKREVAVSSLWTLLDDGWREAVANTKEAIESDATTYKGTISLFRDASLIAAAKAITSLPEHAEVDSDETLDREQLESRLTAWVCRERTFRLDNGNTITTSFHDWMLTLPPDSHWQRCYSSNVFGSYTDNQRSLAVRGAVLVEEFKAKSSQKLAAELRQAGLAEADNVAKVTGRSIRVWQFTPSFLASIDAEGGQEDA